MIANDGIVNVDTVLAVLSNEEEFIFKPFQSGPTNDIGAIECGKVVSRMNKPIFDYQIGDKANASVFNPVFYYRITLTIPETKQVVMEFYENRLPLLCQMCSKQEVRYSTTIEGESQSMGTIRKGYV
ncbi:unnamed protein product [Rotaria socialis]|uniref:Uncharacterized protein n=1 Tax=Rotaria socialis TaxID=392032 RepID=A0A820P5R9_9BILA|nr:unnamed protein product [Rotaria socialis]CAF3331397.1 unnamed protein product [Rotaria socialis]CAF3354241.1 unnamed protein product [Rotaria socialis]CAF3596485.1 unnamed protein product [Rotaria socialis]CAF3759030.1 unnamed protein product [Rotaria socialis]